MIINSVIAGGGGDTGVNIYLETYNLTSTQTLSSFFSGRDIRFHYKNSIMFFVTQNNNRASDGTADGKIKYLMIPNINNYSNGTDYKSVGFRTSKVNYDWTIVVSGTKDTYATNVITVNSETGRISSTNATGYIGKNGVKVVKWEIPISEDPTASGDVDTTPWGS